MATKASQTRTGVRSESDDESRLQRLTSTEIISLDLVSAFGGDREMTAEDRRLIRKHQVDRGDRFFSDLVHSLTHHHVDPESAEALWQQILSHKVEISARLGRNVGIAVATHDYLSNITGDLEATILISERHIAEISRQAMRDGMTGLFNHSTCYELLALELRNQRRYGVGLCLLILDVDDFKSINEKRGHQVGDEILVQVAKTLVEETRSSDVCCRVGGDEFVAILRMTSEPSEACKLAERIRTRVATIAIDDDPLTVSIGVAFCNRGGATPKALLERADRALNRAKASGKNRVLMSEHV